MAEKTTSSNEKLTVDNEVIAKIAGRAARNAAGLEEMSGRVADNIADFFGSNNYAKGVGIEVENEEATINLEIITQYGVEIPLLAEKIRNNVRSDVERQTGLKVVAVNVRVKDIAEKKDEKEKQSGEGDGKN